MRDKLKEFETTGVRVACVVQGTAEETSRFCGRHGVDQFCVPDPEKQSYAAMGFPRASWKDLLTPGEYLRRLKEARDAGCSVDFSGAFKKNSDWLQLPGAALVARGGKILWLHRGTHPGDMPSVDELFAVVQKNLVN